MNKLSTGVLLTFCLAGCSSNDPLGSAVAKEVVLTDSPLARLQNASLIRAGDGFTLVGYDGTQVHWGRISVEGVLVPEASFAMAKPVVGPVFAVTQKTSPGDQLVALAVVPSATVSGGYDLMATVHTIGAPAPAAPLLLSAPSWFPARTDPSTIQLAAGAAANGSVGYVAWGIRANKIPISYLLLPADAVTTATPSSFLGDPNSPNAPDWDCLAPQSRFTGFSFSVVTPNPQWATSDFQTVEIDEKGETVFMTYPLTVAVAECRIVGAPASGGSYFMALKGLLSGNTAIDFATFYPSTDPTVNSGSVNTIHPAMAAANFGGPLNMPYPAWVTSAGGDVVIGLSRKAGPQIVRFTYTGVPHGAKLSLRSANGETGPVSASVSEDAVYVTYADQVKSGNTTSTKRYFMRIVSPAQLP
jgi:hypothetical protein